jgi:hypothetical protein
MRMRLIPQVLALVVCLASALVSSVLAAAPATQALSRDAAIARLRDNGVYVRALLDRSGRDGAMISLGIGPTGGPADNANDQNLALVAQIPEIERLFVHKGTFTARGLAALAALDNLRTLGFHSPQVQPGTFASLAELKQLKSLRFSEYAVTDEILGYAGAIRGLKSLEVASFINTTQRMTAAGIARFLQNVTDLEGLVLLGAPLDDAGLARLGQMKNMVRLWTDSRQITSKGWAPLAGLTRMRDLYLRGTTFDDAGAQALAGMKDLRQLMLDDTAITDAGLASLAGLVDLGDLGLANTQVTDKGMEHLKGMTKLHNLYVVGTKVTAKGLAVLPEKREMAMMRIGSKPLTPAEYAELEEMFPRSEIFDTAGYWTRERVRAAKQSLPPKRPTTGP